MLEARILPSSQARWTSYSGVSGVRRKGPVWWRQWPVAAAIVAAGLTLWVVLALGALRVVAPTEGSLLALAARLTPAERKAIREGRVRFLDGLEACRLAARPTPAGAPADRQEVLVILNPPGVFRTRGRWSGGGAGVSDGERVWAITEAAIKLKARLMVDCTNADLARLTPAGWRSVLRAKQAGLWRLVVFDGAHHLPALAADPELLLLPILRSGREALIIHGYVRDALPLASLQRVLANTGLEPAILTIPRFSLPLKENLPLRLVALQVLRRVAERGAPLSPAGKPRQPGTRFSRRIALTGAVGELKRPVCVWDVLLRYPAALAGQPLPWSVNW